MQQFLFYTFFIILLTFQIQAQIISNVKFLSNSSIFSTGRDGVVIVTLDTGEETSICNYKFTEIEAGIVCKSLGYPGHGLSIVSDQRYSLGKVLLGDLKCTGKESHLKYCVHSGRKEFPGLCQKHRMDVHVHCLDNKLPVSKNDSITECKNNADVSLQRLPGNINTGFLQLSYNGKMHYVCNDEFNFDLKAANCYCKKICTNTKHPRPLMFLDRSQFQIDLNSSFVKASCDKCPCSVTKIERCNPSYVVGVQCGDERVVIEKSPDISCNHENITVTWKNDTVPYINSSLVELTPSCANSTIEDAPNGDVNLFMLLGDCNPKIKEDSEYVSYTYNIRRSYTPVGITLRNPVNVLAQCRVVKRNQITNKLEFKTATAASLQANAKINTDMKLYIDGSFSVEMKSEDKVDFNKPMFVKVYLTNPPKDVKLNLYNCAVSHYERFNNSNIVPLINEMCPNENHGVKVTYLSRSEIGFQFQPFNFIDQPNMPIYLKCETTKCYVPNDRYCGVCNSRSRIKRSIPDDSKEAVTVGPIWISNNRSFRNMIIW